MMEIAKQIKQDPQKLDHDWGKGHNWDSAIISVTIERIKDVAHTVSIREIRKVEDRGASSHPAFTRYMGCSRVLEGDPRSQ